MKWPGQDMKAAWTKRRNGWIHSNRRRWREKSKEDKIERRIDRATDSEEKKYGPAGEARGIGERRGQRKINGWFKPPTKDTKALKSKCWTCQERENF
jgi:hypothetical protein